MKLVRYGKPGKEKPGLIDGAGKLRDLSGVIDDLAGDALSPKSLAKIAKLKRVRDVVAVAGGHGSLGTKLGDSIIAYALPK